MGTRHLCGCSQGGGQPVPLGSVALHWDMVASHGTLSSLVPVVGQEVAALRIFPKVKPVVPLLSPRPVARMVVDPVEAGVECSEGHLRVCAPVCSALLMVIVAWLSSGHLKRSSPLGCRAVG